MKKPVKIAVIVLITVLVTSSLVLASQSELFQGRFSFFRKPALNYSAIYLYKDKVVSAVTTPVTSAVPSVVVSKVTSSGGTSKVASVVVSAVTTPVASAVAVDKRTASKVNTKN
ncbi:hypothetical protein HOE67_02760 [Candidatus Peregrinibacteria bacterium]|jgi:hypothetical protein|nr:hypothetical protein [Candidatus Peregrinibacteria bacterium]MBT4056008.1 hypothetical protein [Candidatus Peregrinibacteria bacterium]